MLRLLFPAAFILALMLTVADLLQRAAVALTKAVYASGGIQP